MSFTQRTREAINTRIVAGATVLTLGFTASACSNPFETGEIGGIEVPESDMTAAGENPSANDNDQESTLQADVDGDGEADDTVIINGGAEQSDDTPNLLEDANQTAGSGSMSSGELETENGSIILDLFGTEGLKVREGTAYESAYEDVMSQLLDGTYEYDIAVGHWEGLFIEYNPDDVNEEVTVHFMPVYFEDAEYGKAFLVSSHEIGEDGETAYKPRGVRIGTFEPEQPGSISVTTYPTHYYLGGDGKTVTSNRVTFANPGTPESPVAIEDLQFKADDGRGFTPTFARYDISQLDRILAAAEASGMPIFTHERNQPAGVITSQ